jgi:hypothetical protein
MSLLSTKDYDLALEALSFYLQEKISELEEGKFRETVALRQWLILEKAKKN